MNNQDTVVIESDVGGQKVDIVCGIKGAFDVGGTGIVFYSESADRSARVAIKVISICRNLKCLDELPQEVEYSRKLSSFPECFPRYLGAAVRDYFLYIYMDYVPGGSLADVVERHRAFDLPNAISCACDILKALTHLSSLSLAHLDIKPRNLMFGGDGHLRLIDFGWMCEFGTPHVLELEDLNAYWDPACTERGAVAIPENDIYSFGKVILYMLLGSDPSGELFIRHSKFEGHSELEQLLDRSLDEDPRFRSSASALLSIIEPVCANLQSKCTLTREPHLPMEEQLKFCPQSTVDEWFEEGRPSLDIDMAELDVRVCDLCRRIE